MSHVRHHALTRYPGTLCHATKTDGTPCKRYAVLGATVCPSHGGFAPQVRRSAAIRAEVMAWGLTEAHEDPGEILLRLVSQSARRAELYAGLLAEQYAKADAGDSETTLPARVAVLIGHKYALDPDGAAVAVDEAIRGLVALEMQERELCGSLASKAIAAGLAERSVRLAERQGAMIAEVLRAVLSDPALGLTVDQRAAVPAVIRAHLALA